MNTKIAALQIRITNTTKDGFELAAKLAAIPLSSCDRQRLRLAAIRELEGAALRIPFVEPIRLGQSHG